MYDLEGNVLSVTPPSRPAHGFTPNAADLLASYLPPAGAATAYGYDKDRLLTAETPPLFAKTTEHDRAGRVKKITEGPRTREFTYELGHPKRSDAKTSGALDVGLVRTWQGSLLAQEQQTLGSGTERCRGVWRGG